MGIEKIPVEQFVQLSEIHTVIDVRSDAEYAHAHIPGAYSVPLFNDEERAVVGTIYKQQSREDAIKKGLEFFGPKMKEMLLSAERLIKEKNPDNKTVLVHCWRGGMRSAAVAWLLDLYGFKVFTLIGGYKAFRNWVLKEFTQKHPFQILGGNTGSGKTIVLQSLQELNEAVVDLEGLAGHKGSAFGNIGLPKQPSQEMFENKLAVEIKKTKEKHPNKKIWLEDESQRIGTVNIPQDMWLHMRKCNLVFLDIPFAARLQYLVATYGKLNWTSLRDAILRIQKRLGGLETKTALAALDEQNFHDCFEVLLKYYDKQYRKGLENREEPKPEIKMVLADNVNDMENAKLIIKLKNGRD
ncbi:MAG: tRNA 2-selenouridine(34) synthase MnmH [Bacteroidota bacterium]|jgi:tRNA 2-selenouridine synthase